jgi:hypothetical protein
MIGMVYESWMIGEIEDPVEDIKAHERLIQEETRQLVWVDEEQEEKIRQDINWRLREISRLKRLLKKDSA